MLLSDTYSYSKLLTHLTPGQIIINLTLQPYLSFTQYIVCGFQLHTKMLITSIPITRYIMSSFQQKNYKAR